MFTAGVLLISLFVLFILASYRASILLLGFYFLAVSGVLLWHQFFALENQDILILPIVLGLLALLFLFFSIPAIRRTFFIRPIFKILKKKMPIISDTERQALDAGEVGFEKGFFSGYPDWNILRNIPIPKLTEKEEKFLNDPVEKLCQMIDVWIIRHELGEIPSQVWDFSLKNNFFGLRISKEDGGPSFSFQAQSIIFSKIASRSLDMATVIGVQNSLGPDELIKKYGTDEQKKHYLPRFIQGKDIVSFAITSPHGGSDIPSMRDIGNIVYGDYNNKKVLGVRLTWNKRYITFAPKATLLVLAFRLLDPDNLLEKEQKDMGITLALIPTNHPGVISSHHHIVGGAVFPNGPTQGKDVFIPIDMIIGGKNGVGKGWKMVMESLFIGRAVTLPAMSTAVVKSMLRYSTAYASTRRQFGSPISTFEGVEEPLIRLVEAAYLTESARSVTSAMIDGGKRPISVASIMKYQTTEYARRAVNDAMDIHGGRGICDGPSNYLQSAYQMAPIGITVEGANIVTRSLITFAQGVLRAHPYMHLEMSSFAHPDEKQGIVIFDHAFLGHISLLISNICRSIFHNITGGVFGNAPKNIPSRVAKLYRQLWRASSNFAYIADITAALLGGKLKKKQKIGGRLADALSELYFLSCILKRYEDDGFPEDDYPIVELCATNSLYRFKYAINRVTHNFPNVFARFLFKILSFRFGVNWKQSSDELGHTAVSLVLQPGETRDRLTQFIYASNNPDDPTALLETAFKKSAEAGLAYKKVREAIKIGTLPRSFSSNWIDEAERKKILTKEESEIIREADRLTERVIAVDHFDSSEKVFNYKNKK